MRTRIGPELLARKGDKSTVDGFLTVAERHGWSVVPTLETMAMPSGTIDHAVFETFWADVRRAGAPRPRGGDRRHLAGAPRRDGDHRLGRSRGRPAGADPRLARREGPAAVRRVRPARDFTPKMARYADGLVGYRENPHTDAFDAAALSAELLARSLATGVRPRIVSQHLSRALAADRDGHGRRARCAP